MDNPKQSREYLEICRDDCIQSRIIRMRRARFYARTTGAPTNERIHARMMVKANVQGARSLNRMALGYQRQLNELEG